jgi:hypothetical protein
LVSFSLGWSWSDVNICSTSSKNHVNMTLTREGKLSVDRDMVLCFNSFMFRSSINKLVLLHHVTAHHR